MLEHHTVTKEMKKMEHRIEKTVTAKGRHIGRTELIAEMKKVGHTERKDLNLLGRCLFSAGH